MRFTRARATVAMAVLTVSLFAAACSSDGHTATSTSAADARGVTGESAPASTVDTSGMTLKVGISAETPLNVTHTLSGAFDGTPYKVEWVNFDGSNAIMEALAAGAVDVSFTLQAPVPVIAQANAAKPWTSATAPVSLVAAWLTPGSGFVLLVHPGSGITDIRGLAGKSVALARGTLGQYWLLSAAEHARLASDAIKQSVMPAPDGRTAFRSGAVDALITGYRTGLALARTGDGTIIASSNDVVPFYTVTVVRAGVLDDAARAAAVNDMLRRLQANEVWFHDHPDLAAKSFVDQNDMNPADALASAKSEWRVREPLDDTTARLLQQQADFFAKAGVAKSTVDVTVLFDRRFDAGVVRSS
ncbi:MAG: ABC transporter substrate-binding protein [Actinomycetota bacterium]